jgi:F0F1-type ATP synthase membrane subunit b/b'
MESGSAGSRGEKRFSPVSSRRGETNKKGFCLFRKNFDTIAIALIFVVAAKLLERFNFWGAIGLSTPTFLIVSGLMFLSLVIILQHTIFEPFAAISNERVEQTTEKRKRADERKIHAESILKSYEQSILNARMEAMKQRERIAMEAEASERKILSVAKEKSQKDLETAVKEIHEKIEEIKNDLVQSSGPLVQQLVDDVLAIQVSGKSDKSSSKSAETRM